MAQALVKSRMGVLLDSETIYFDSAKKGNAFYICLNFDRNIVGYMVHYGGEGDRLSCLNLETRAVSGHDIQHGDRTITISGFESRGAILAAIDNYVGGWGSSPSPMSDVIIDAAKHNHIARKGYIDDSTIRHSYVGLATAYTSFLPLSETERRRLVRCEEVLSLFDFANYYLDGEYFKGQVRSYHNINQAKVRFKGDVKLMYLDTADMEDQKDNPYLEIRCGEHYMGAFTSSVPVPGISRPYAVYITAGDESIQGTDYASKCTIYIEGPDGPLSSANNEQLVRWITHLRHIPSPRPAHKWVHAVNDMVTLGQGFSPDSCTIIGRFFKQRVDITAPFNFNMLPVPFYLVSHGETQKHVSEEDLVQLAITLSYAVAVPRAIDNYVIHDNQGALDIIKSAMLSKPTQDVIGKWCRQTKLEYYFNLFISAFVQDIPLESKTIDQMRRGDIVLKLLGASTYSNMLHAWLKQEQYFTIDAIKSRFEAPDPVITLSEELKAGIMTLNQSSSSQLDIRPGEHYMGVERSTGRCIYFTGAASSGGAIAGHCRIYNDIGLEHDGTWIPNNSSLVRKISHIVRIPSDRTYKWAYEDDDTVQLGHGISPNSCTIIGMFFKMRVDTIIPFYYVLHGYDTYKQVSAEDLLKLRAVTTGSSTPPGSEGAAQFRATLRFTCSS